MIDLQEMRHGLAAPGMDTRTWISYGIVEPDTPDSPSVQFKDENGNPHPEGVLVLVKLSDNGGTIVNCRVGSDVAGNGEASYHPFLPGDEVLVAVPMGDEASGCMIIRRCNQSIDKFPTSVGGEDPTTNTFGFTRMIPPYIFETASSYKVISALTHASFVIDLTGGVFLNSGDKHLFAMTSSAITLQEGTGVALLQIDPGTLGITMQAQDNQWRLDPTGATLIANNVSMGSGGYLPIYHLMTFEAVANILQNFMLQVGVILAAVPAAGTAAAIAAAFTAGAQTVPGTTFTAATSPATGVLSPTTATAVTAAISAQIAPSYGSLAIKDALGVYPGVCRTSFLVS